MPTRWATSYPATRAVRNSFPVLPSCCPRHQAAGIILAEIWVLDAGCTSSSSRVWASMALSMAPSVTDHFCSRGCPHRVTPWVRFWGSSVWRACFICSTRRSPTAPMAALIRSRARQTAAFWTVSGSVSQERPAANWASLPRGAASTLFSIVLPQLSLNRLIMEPASRVFRSVSLRIFRSRWRVRVLPSVPITVASMPPLFSATT